ncbi:MAG: DUF402 domain-containing protein, partial [Staphylothermus sp.]|nr:DUF402 domain-containing protein [Staphylothermus sp.]
MVLANVRIRGIAATSITKILLDKGHRIVQASNIIRERFGLEQDTSPAEVTVKDADVDELLIIGFHNPAKKVTKDLVDTLKYLFTWVSPVGLHSIHVGIVREKKDNTCIVEIDNGLKGILRDCNLEPSKRVVVSVVKAPIKPGEPLFLSRSIRVIGKYIALLHGSRKISLSEHIRDQSKRDYLVALAASKLIGTGLGIHFRSSSAHASQEDIEKEIEELRKQLVEIIEKTKNIEEAPIQLYEGEYIALLGLTSKAKEILDNYRAQVIPTVKFHHSYKSHGNTLSELVDFSENLIAEGVSEEIVSNALKKYIIEKYKSYPRIKIIHKKSDGTTLLLTPGTLYKTWIKNNQHFIVIKRIFKSNGVYDGFNIEKKPGDIDYMLVVEDEWFISHNYYRGEEWLGTYININTPPEILPNTIKYHDLAADIVVKNDYTVEI